jgi:hypothetical protein
MKGKISAAEPVCVIIDEENHAEPFEAPGCARDVRHRGESFGVTVP